MKKIIGILITTSLIVAQSNNATMTMYKDGFGLVKQPVSWDLTLGQDTISWDLLPLGLIKDSPFLTLKNAIVNMQRLNQDVFYFSEYLNNYLGKIIELELINGTSFKGTLVEKRGDNITITQKRTTISFNKDRINYITVPGKPSNAIFKPSLSWGISPYNRSGTVTGNLIYLSKGFDWDATYRLILDEEGNNAEFLAEAYIKNNSNLDFNNLSIQLVEGRLKKDGNINKMLRSMKNSETESEMNQDPLGDYHIYSLANKINLKGEESITTRLYSSRVVSFKKTYLFENDEKSQKEEPLGIEYEISNTKLNNLGVPLPKGKIQLYQSALNGNIEYVGEDEIRQVPKGANAKIISGRAFNVVGKRKVLNYDRQRKSEEGTISIEVSNTLSKDIKIRLIEHIYGDWVVRDASANYRKKDASTIYFPIKVPANSSETVTYTYRKEWK
ncbi:MAG: DUF4139 domain-containing protein [Fidelibacterota bacterium]|jgi:hypothetical protein|tara:strand:- start:2331 stop:3659 length:1329 start_codon:yes stop_codon:yes gene_type:complete